MATNSSVLEKNVLTFRS
ncbi:unnamed protein product, partial [Didymodactylos carnosus]